MKNTPATKPATYPAGTLIGHVVKFDRSQHVQFRCPDHDTSVWVSKDPFVSSWFPASDETIDCPRTCGTMLRYYAITDDYTPGVARRRN